MTYISLKILCLLFLVIIMIISVLLLSLFFLLIYTFVIVFSILKHSNQHNTNNLYTPKCNKPKNKPRISPVSYYNLMYNKLSYRCCKKTAECNRVQNRTNFIPKSTNCLCWHQAVECSIEEICQYYAN